MLRPTSTKWAPDETDWVDWLVAAALFVAVMIVLARTSSMGIPRDESFYFHAAGEYGNWFKELVRNYRAGELWESFTKSNIDKHWSYNSEHPVLMKSLFALSNLLFDNTLGWMRPMLAMRLPAMATAAGCVAITYLFARQTFGRLAGLTAGAALLFQPRFFFHGHLSCFDVPITFFWMATVYAYWRSLDDTRWALATGVIWGLALCTKLNAFFLPVVLTGHWLLTNWKDLRVRRSEAGRVISLPSMPWALVSMAILGPIVFYALTPRFWFNTAHRVGKYIAFHLNHVHYFVYYFGENVLRPPLPISYPWVMTVVTVPAAILIAAGFGFVHAGLQWDPVDWAKRWRRRLTEGSLPRRGQGDPRGTGLLLAMNLLFPIALISQPSTPIFGGTKHWMPAMPFLAIFAGAGIALAARLLSEAALPAGENWTARAARGSAAALLAASVTLPAVYATAHIHPFGTSYYNEFIGSIRGAADHRMFRQFWGYAARQSFPWLNEHAEKNGRVWTHNTTGYAWWHYHRAKLVRQDLHQAGIGGSDYGLFHHQKAFSRQQMKVWNKYETFAPAHVVSQEGVPLLSLYRRPRLLEKTTAQKADPPKPPESPESGTADAGSQRGPKATDAGSTSGD